MSAREENSSTWSFVQPSATALELKRWGEAARASHLGLWLERFLPWPSWSLERRGPTLQQALESVCGAWHVPLAAGALERQVETLLEQVESLGGARLRAHYQIRGRLVLDEGVGSSRVRFHAVLGVPFLSGQLLKSATRDYLHRLTRLSPLTAADVREILGLRVRRSPPLESADSFGRPFCLASDLELMGPPEHLSDTLFGRPGVQGRAAFFDALPLDGRFSLDADVRTPHEGFAQGEQTLGRVWTRPEPSSFLTVVETTFAVTIGIFPPSVSSPDAASEGDSGMVQEGRLRLLAAFLDALLEETLRDRGLGARRRAGYGHFSRRALQRIEGAASRPEKPLRDDSPADGSG